MGCTWSSRLRRAFVGFTLRHVESHDFRCQIDLYSSRRMDPNVPDLVLVEWIMAVTGGQFFLFVPAVDERRICRKVKLIPRLCLGVKGFNSVKVDDR